jgi:hypothetical protein
MIPVSESYNPYKRARHLDIAIALDATEKNALTGCTFTANDEESISNLNQLKVEDFKDIKYATCENNLVMLDGTYNYLPDTLTNEHIGWWSTEISDENGDFQTYPTLTAQLNKTYDVVGFSIYSSKENAIAECNISVYNNEELIYNETFVSENELLIADIPTTNFNKVIVQVTKTLQPYRRVKVLSFLFGIKKNWNKNDIISASISEGASILSETIEISELVFEIYDPMNYFGNQHADRKYVYKKASVTALASQVNNGSISKLNQIKDLKTQLYKYATCEPDFTMLDGTYNYLPDNNIPDELQIGFINNELSDLNNSFTNNPKIIYTWRGSIGFSGLRIYFGEDNYATKINIKAYYNNGLIASKDYTNNQAVCEFNFSVTKCDKIELEFIEVNKPYRYLKISDIQILRYSESWVSYLTRNQNISASIIVEGEKINVGSKYQFYKLDESGNELTAKIIAKDYMEKLDRQNYTGGQSGTSTLNEMLQSVLNKTEIPINYSDNSLANTTVSRATPKDTSKRAALHYLTQAAQCTCFLDRNRVLQVRPFNTGSTFTDSYNMDNIYDSNIFRMNDYVNMVRLTVTDEYNEQEESHTYHGGSGLYYREVENGCVATINGQAVANWLLTQYKRRVYFEIKTRGNPATELGDTIQVELQDGTIYLAVVYEQVYEYNGGLQATLKAVAETESS